MIAKKGACFTGKSRICNMAGHPAEHEALTQAVREQIGKGEASCNLAHQDWCDAL